LGSLIEGRWHNEPPKKSASGKFIRKDSSFRNWITVDGSAGPTGEGGFEAEAGRYHLYVSLACPWAHRTLIFRKIKGLEDKISISVVNSFMGDQGWSFDEGDGVIADTVNGKTYLYEIYTEATPDYTGRATVPILWDMDRQTIVSNESSEIIRMFNSAFDEIGAAPGDYYPQTLRDEIDELNDRIYPNVNNGVYRAGFAKSQEAYEEAVTDVFRVLDRLEERLENQRYLTGDQITEADWLLLPTLLRFDPVYVGHFKCNIRRLVDYPNLWGYTKDLYQVPGVADTVNTEYNRQHYYRSHEGVNPTRIVPVGPQIDFTQPHGRERLSK
jgi:glutathionyl-hydroquinone reductase